MSLSIAAKEFVPKTTATKTFSLLSAEVPEFIPRVDTTKQKKRTFDKKPVKLKDYPYKNREDILPDSKGGGKRNNQKKSEKNCDGMLDGTKTLSTEKEKRGSSWKESQDHVPRSSMSWSAIVKKLPPPPSPPPTKKSQPASRKIEQTKSVNSFFSSSKFTKKGGSDSANWRLNKVEEYQNPSKTLGENSSSISPSRTALSEKVVPSMKNKKPSEKLDDLETTVIKKKLTRTTAVYFSKTRSNNTAKGETHQESKEKEDSSDDFLSVRKLAQSYRQSVEQGKENFRISKPKHRKQNQEKQAKAESKLKLKDFLNTPSSSISPGISYSAALKKNAEEVKQMQPQPEKEMTLEEKIALKKKNKALKRKLKAKQKKLEKRQEREANGESTSHPASNTKLSEQEMKLDISDMLDKLMAKPKEPSSKKDNTSKSAKALQSKRKVVVSTGVISVVPGLAKKKTLDGKKVQRNKPPELTKDPKRPPLAKQPDFQVKKDKSMKSGNIQTILDGATLIRKRGKERETPKKKKPTLLKKIINAERERRKKLREVEAVKTEEKNRTKNEAEETCKSAVSQGKEEKHEGEFVLGTRTEKSSLEAVSVNDSHKAEEESSKEETVEKDVHNSATDETLPCKPLTDLPEAVWKKIHSRKFREYCNHMLSKEINSVTQVLLQTLQRFQDRVYHENQSKFRQKRRYVLGLREVLKHLKVKKLKAVIIAPNLERIVSKGGIDDYLSSILELCKEQNIATIFAMNRHNLGYTLKKKAPVSIVGIFNYDGAQETYKELMELIEDGKKKYNEQVKEAVKDNTKNNNKNSKQQTRNDEKNTKKKKNSEGEIIKETMLSKLQIPDNMNDFSLNSESISSSFQYNDSRSQIGYSYNRDYSSRLRMRAWRTHYDDGNVFADYTNMDYNDTSFQTNQYSSRIDDYMPNFRYEEATDFSYENPQQNVSQQYTYQYSYQPSLYLPTSS